MKRALQAILMSASDEQWENILSKVKEITIREGERDYVPGFCVLTNIDTNRSVGADITSVRHCKLKEVTHIECLEDNFRDHEDMYEGMKKYYPNMTPESDVTIIRWNNARGLLMDQYNAKK
jgi:hypothetical protein